VGHDTVRGEVTSDFFSTNGFGINLTKCFEFIVALKNTGPMTLCALTALLACDVKVLKGDC